VRRLLIAALLTIVGCGGGDPTSFGLNVTVDAHGVASGDLARVTTANLTVSGAEDYTKSFDISSPIKSGEVRFRYIPRAQSGQLTLTLDVTDAAGVVVASGVSDAVDLVAGKAVAVRIVLGMPSTDMGTDDGGNAGGDMALKNQGASCTQSSECGTAGGCVDGYCCDTTCGNACKACNVTGKEGICSPIAAGATPTSGHATCGPDPASSCQRDGKCDGAGACRKYQLGTVCQAGTCNSTTNMVTSDSTCDGNGTCTAGTTITCAPYVCKDASVCWPSCTSGGSECSAGNVCNGNSCGKKPLGSTCAASSECQNGTDSNPHCVDGVCCDVPCGGTCQYCALSSLKGTCSLVPAGQDPRNVCAAGSNTICRPGGCTGSTTACTIATQGTACSASCSGATPQTTTCDANGNCSQTTNGSPCPECKVCSVSGLTSSCINATNGTACGPAPSCGGPINSYGYYGVRYLQATCNGGACGAQPTVSCAPYACFMSGSAPTCFSGCGCCTPNCAFPPPPADTQCYTGHSCGSGTCTNPPGYGMCQ
jgi:hypothetical protein